MVLLTDFFQHSPGESPHKQVPGGLSFPITETGLQAKYICNLRLPGGVKGHGDSKN